MSNAYRQRVALGLAPQRQSHAASRISEFGRDTSDGRNTGSHLLAIVKASSEEHRTRPVPWTGTTEPCISSTRAADMDVKRGWASALHLDLVTAARRSVASERGRGRGWPDTADDARTAGDLLSAFIHVSNDDGTRALSHAMAVLERTEDPKSAYVAAVLCRSAYWLRGDLHGFDGIGRTEPPLGAGRRISLASLVDRSLAAAVDLQQLRLPMAGRLSRHVIEAASLNGRPTAACLLPSVVLAQIAYEQGDLVEADAAVRAILPHIRTAGTAETAVRAYTTLARAAAGRGHSEFAVAMLREGEALGDARRWPRLSVACLAEWTELLIRTGRRAEADTAFERLSVLCQLEDRIGEADNGFAFHLELVRCRMWGLGGCHGNEVTMIRRFLTEVLARGDLLRGFKLAVRLVGALARADDAPAAADILAQLIAIACDTGLFQTILDGDPEVRDVLHSLQSTLAVPHLNAFAAMLLERWPQSAPDDRITRGEKRSEGILTPRERNVLHFMSLGDSNKHIARRLGIAPETVKSHVKNIFMRLGSSTRAEAVSRAASLGMV